MAKASAVVRTHVPAKQGKAGPAEVRLLISAQTSMVKNRYRCANEQTSSKATG